MAQLFGEHRQHLRRAGVLQPIAIDVNGAGAARIGASRPRHRSRRQQLDRRQVGHLPGGQTRNQAPQRIRLRWELQRLPHSRRQGSVSGPPLQQQPPALKMKGQQLLNV
jgi:hypothetical protein